MVSLRFTISGFGCQVSPFGAGTLETLPSIGDGKAKSGNGYNRKYSIDGFLPYDFALAKGFPASSAGAFASL